MERPHNFDDLVIPTLLGAKNPMMIDEFGGGETVNTVGKVPDKLTKEEDLAFAEPLIPVFSEKLIMMLFSTDWHTRESALRTIKEEVGLQGDSTILGSKDHEELFISVFQIASKTATDKIA